MAGLTDPAAQPGPTELYSMLALTPQGENTFTGVPVGGRFHRMFGGQLIGQATVAAAATVAPGRAAHSFHGYFLGPGSITETIVVRVQPIKDGRTFSLRTVTAAQNGRVVLTATISFQDVPAAAPSYQRPPLGHYPEPEDLPTDEAWARDAPSAHRSAVELRRVPESMLPGTGANLQALWLRARTVTGSRTPAERRAAVALCSDFTVLEPVLAGHGVALGAARSIASLDHAFWWHADADPADWLLYVKESRWSGDERGLVTGWLYDRSGALVASLAQEGHIRLGARA